MADTKTIKEVYERNAKAIKLRPSKGKSIGKSKITVTDGTTCKIEGSGWTLTGDIGTESGGNNAGPGPGVFERAALGSCLAMGYAQQAAVLGVSIDNIEVEIETAFDARGMFGIDNRSPGFSSIKYSVYVESPAPEKEVKKVIEVADIYSPVRDDFSREIPVERSKINIIKS